MDSCCSNTKIFQPITALILLVHFQITFSLHAFVSSDRRRLRRPRRPCAARLHNPVRFPSGSSVVVSLVSDSTMTSFFFFFCTRSCLTRSSPTAFKLRLQPGLNFLAGLLFSLLLPVVVEICLWLILFFCSSGSSQVLAIRVVTTSCKVLELAVDLPGPLCVP